MSIEGAMSSALNGLNAFSTQVGNISDNLANTSTVGYKRVDTRFNELLGGPTGIYSDPMSVRAAPIYRNDLAGVVTRTDNATAFSITEGQGFAPVADLTNNLGVASIGADTHYTRAGDFTPDANGYLVNSGGQVLKAVPESATFSNTFPDAPSAGGLVPVRIDPATYATAPAAASTVINYNANFPASIASVPTPADGGPPAGTDPDQNVSVAFHDSLGTSHTLALSFRKTAPDTWAAVGATVKDTPETPVPLPTSPYPTVNFDQYGSLAATTTLPFAIPTLGNNGTVGTLTLNLGAPANQSTQYTGIAMDIRNTTDVTGRASGNFTGASISSDGYVTFKYTNSQAYTPYRIPLASFTNPDGLERLTGATLGDNPQVAGTANYAWSGNSQVGSLVPNTQEQSNVDVASELTKMITAQRSYSSNAKVISTSDAMSETAIGLKT